MQQFSQSMARSRRFIQFWEGSQPSLRLGWCTLADERKRKASKEVFDPMLLANHGGRFFVNHGWWWLVGGVVPFLLVLALIGLAIWAILRLTSHGSPLLPATRAGAAVARPDGALEEVRLRYARGELSREEFLQRSEDLGGVGPARPEPGPSGPE